MNTQEWDDYLYQFAAKQTGELCTFTITEEPTTKFAIIIEFREDPRLILVINNFMSLLAPKGWGLIVFHGTKNREFVRSSLRHNPRIIFGEVPYENINAELYSYFLCSADFWTAIQRFNCEHALIFQMDTILLRGDLEKFLEYDYVGAPWFAPWRFHASEQGVIDETVQIGNGGLSLRRVSAMLDIIRKYPRNDPQFYNEDMYFAYCLKVGNYKLPSVEVAGEFSIETLWHPNPCGMHQPHVDKMPTDPFNGLLETRHTDIVFKAPKEPEAPTVMEPNDMDLVD
jgi:hypothetical protein